MQANLLSRQPNFILSGMRVRKETLATIYDGVRVLHESTAYDAWIEEGEKRGALRSSHRLLLLLGKDRFGAADADTESGIRVPLTTWTASNAWPMLS